MMLEELCTTTTMMVVEVVVAIEQLEAIVLEMD